MPLSLKEFKDRYLYRTAVGYAIAAWLTLQVSSLVLSALDAPRWMMKALIGAIFLGFLVALLVGWKQERSPIAGGPVSASQRHRFVLALTALLPAIAVALGFLIFYHPAPRAGARNQNPAVPEKSIAVLPFANLSTDNENAFFADGMQDEILTDLAKIADLKVISRTSVQQYRSGVSRNIREIAQALGVVFVLEGSVQRAANTVRVSAQLIDARNDAHVWAEHFDGDLGDVFGIQTRIAQMIADQLRVQVSPAEKAAISRPATQDAAAHDLYLRGNQLLSAVLADYSHGKEKLTEALELFDKAVARDPKFLLAYCRASQAHVTLYWLELDRTPERLALADAALRKAQGIQPDSDELHFAFGWYYYQGLRDYERARAELRLAQRSFPNDADILSLSGSIDRRQGHWKQSTSELERAVAVDPGNLFRLQQLAASYHVLRRYADEQQIYDRALAIAPGDKSMPVARARIALDAHGDTRPLRETITKLLQQDAKAADEFPAGLLDQTLCDRDRAAAERALSSITSGELIFFFRTPPEFLEGFIARCFGDKARAESAFTRARVEQDKIVRDQPNYAAGIGILGLIDAALGRKQEAIREGERACELAPLDQDAVDGAELTTNLALIYAWSGESDRAFEHLTTIVRVPNNLSYGLLKLHPEWDGLRNDPRFDQLLARMKTEPQL
ncbi:MAG TPA: FlgO family outer membrane protein [Chthoniobacterales bacterium]|nr:FlgO family outer membrane protein [Chthoniobacterales bacterium]